MPVFLTRVANILVITIQQEISKSLAGSLAEHVAAHLGEGEAKLASPSGRNVEVLIEKRHEVLQISISISLQYNYICPKLIVQA